MLPFHIKRCVFLKLSLLWAFVHLNATSLLAGTAKPNMMYEVVGSDGHKTAGSSSSQEEQPIISSTFTATTVDAPSCDPVQNPNDVDFTLVTQTSMDRLFMMEKHCARWGQHPISLAVSTGASEIVVQKALVALGCDLNLVHVETLMSDEETKDNNYPVNQLRNLALSNVQTTHAVIIDVDFLLATDTYETLRQHQNLMAQEHKTAMVIPAFEFRALCSSSNAGCQRLHETLVPNTKSELLEFYLDQEDTTIEPFDSKSNFHGHGSTRYNDWISQKDDELFPIDCVTSPRYEPYLVVRYCQELPPFQEVFRGYGQNKITWMQQLLRTGYKLFQLPVFAIHFPHKPSDARKSWDRQRKRHTDKSALEVNQISSQFREWMEMSIPDQTVVSQC